MATIQKAMGQGFASGEMYTVLNNFNGMAADASISVDVGDTAATVTIQLKDWNGDDLAVPGTVICYLSSSSTGLDFNDATVTTETAIATDGSLAILLAKIAYLVTSEANGDIGLTITDTSDDVYYLVVVLPTGKLVVSDAMTFAS